MKRSRRRRIGAVRTVLGQLDDVRSRLREESVRAMHARSAALRSSADAAAWKVLSALLGVVIGALVVALMAMKG